MFVKTDHPAAGVALVTLARPERMNALSMAVVEDLIAALEAVAADERIGAVILTGAGRGFCTGGDVKEMVSNRDKTLEQRHADLARMHVVPRLIAGMDKVVVGAVNGPAYGAGLSVALTCDLVLASETATFGTAFLKQGLVSDFGLSYQLTRLAGPAAARRIIFLDEVFGAVQARELGLVSAVLPADRLLQEATAHAVRIAAWPAKARGAMKALLRQAETLSHDAMLDAEAEMQGRFIVSREHAAAVDAVNR